jgi:drug/metabolite transporter (DMT)-like permease
LAAFLYLGSGIGLLAIKLLWGRDDQAVETEARLTKPDLVWLAGAILAGGVAAPITLLFSLRDTPAATASLLLNFEGVATTLIALLAFREAISKRAWWAIGLITLSSMFLSINPRAGWGFSFSALGIILACILWGIDNNFTRNICAKDPLMIVTIKGLAAGTFSLGMAIALDNRLPGLAVVFGAMLLGCFSYGVSISLFIHAMRGLGAARTSALFGTAPLAGMLLSLVLFRELPNWLFVAALALMIIGTLVLLREQHEPS